jgi:AcrR family transcriptional regulator
MARSAPPKSRSRSRTPAPSKQRRWHAADHEQRKAFIIAAALDLLRRQGLDQVTMRRVAQRLGVGAMTLYTYINGQEELRRAMIRRGFDLLHCGCQQASTLGTAQGWRGGAAHYVNFALENPRLYELMFSTPIPQDDLDLLHGGFQTLLDRVRERLTEQGIPKDQLDYESRRRAGRFWIALHGLASLAISHRLTVLPDALDQLLDDLLERVAPDAG